MELTYPPKMAYLKMIFRTSPGGICIHSLEGIILTASFLIKEKIVFFLGGDLWPSVTFSNSSSSSSFRVVFVALRVREDS